MSLQFFEDGFDYKKYISDRLLDIDDSDKRSQIKEAVADMLIPFYEHVEASYKNIKEKMLQARNEYQGRFQIITGIKEKRNIDITECGMFPMRMEDLEETFVSAKELIESVKQQKEYRIYSVFIQADYCVIRDIEQTKRKFKAIIKTNRGEYPASVRLQKNKEYLNLIKELYSDFLNNGIEWKTVCAPYLHKIFDVLLIKTECPQDEEIQKITPQFEEYEPYMKYDYVPVWNIRKIKCKTSAYPEFCLDKIHYEHRIFEAKIVKENDYLVLGERQLWNVYRLRGDLLIQCDEAMPVEWELREFCYKQSGKPDELPYMKNEKSASRRTVRTIAEAKKYVEALECGDYITLDDINQKPHNQEDATYICDDFIIDEIRTLTNGPELYFEFIPKNADNILTKDIMSYVISRLQLIYPEYQCKGILK